MTTASPFAWPFVFAPRCCGRERWVCEGRPWLPEWRAYTCFCNIYKAEFGPPCFPQPSTDEWTFIKQVSWPPPDAQGRYRDVFVPYLAAPVVVPRRPPPPPPDAQWRRPTPSTSSASTSSASSFDQGTPLSPFPSSVVSSAESEDVIWI